MSYADEILRRAFRNCIRNGPGNVRECLTRAEGALTRARFEAIRRAHRRGELAGLWDEIDKRTRKEAQMRERFNTVYVHPVFRGSTRTSVRQGRRMHTARSALPARNIFGAEPLAGFEGRLTAAQRRRIPSSSFALSGRRYPVHNCSHARNALSRASMSYHRGNLTRKEHATVVRRARAAMRRLCN